MPYNLKLTGIPAEQAGKRDLVIEAGDIDSVAGLKDEILKKNTGAWPVFSEFFC